ncbi:DUF1028 domain-containing protein [Bacteroidota bacterium]|nr:DUF1028 domain-containing protein [Bacteroidota bacterium]
MRESKLFHTKHLLLFLVLFFSIKINSQHTFSIVAVDTLTGEIGSAGATCGDSIIWPGTPGAYIISDILPGVGAIHTQSFWLSSNQVNARARMQQGFSPDEIINWLVSNDVQNNPQSRQYGVVDYQNGSARSAAFTGSGCYDYKNHILGPNYAIQGNILLGQQILDSMEYHFLNTEGCLPDKLMAAMLAARVVGADTRCFSEGTSSLSAFLRMALPTDNYNQLLLDINVAGTAPNVEPIDVLENKFIQWKNDHPTYCQNLSFPSFTDENSIRIHPNPTEGIVYISGVEETTIIEVYNIKGVLVDSTVGNSISLNPHPNGVYIIKIKDGDHVEELKITKR